MELKEVPRNIKNGIEAGLTDLVAATAGSVPGVRDLPFVRDSVELSELHRRNVHDRDVELLVSDGLDRTAAEESVRRQEIADAAVGAGMSAGAFSRLGSLGRSAVGWQWRAAKSVPGRVAAAGRKIPGAMRAVREAPVRETVSNIAGKVKAKAETAGAWSFLSAEALALAAGGKYVWDHWLTSNASDKKAKADRVDAEYADALASVGREWANATNRMESVSDEAMIRDIMRKSAGARDYAARQLGAGNPEQERAIWEEGNRTVAGVVSKIMQSPDFGKIMERVNSRRSEWAGREADAKFMTEGANYTYDQFVKVKEAEFDRMTPVERIMRTGR